MAMVNSLRCHCLQGCFHPFLIKFSRHSNVSKVTIIYHSIIFVQNLNLRRPTNTDRTGRLQMTDSDGWSDASISLFFWMFYVFFGLFVVSF